MRKTRLVILPGVRSLNKIGCLLLFLACPTIAFKGQENREVEPLCKAQDLKEFWEQESPWPGDLGGLGARKNDLGSRPRLEKLTQQTCNVDASNTKSREKKLEAQRKLPMETRRNAAERRENTRRLDSSVNSRYRSQDNLLSSRRLVQSRSERVAEARAETNQSPDKRRQLDERRASTYRAITGMVSNRERIHRENGSRRDLNRRSEDREARVSTESMRRGLSLNRRAISLENVRHDVRTKSELHDREVGAASRRSALRVDARKDAMREADVRYSRSESRIEARMDNDNMRRGSLDRRTRSTENIRSKMEMRSEQQIRGTRGAQRRSEIREEGRSVRREHDRRDSRSDSRMELRVDNFNMRRGSSLERKMRSVENIRSNMEMRSEQQPGIRGAQRRSELREGRSIRREYEVRDSRSDSRMERVDNDNMRRGSSLDRRTRSTENIRSNMERSEQQIRGIKGAQRRSELREDGRSIRREHEVKDSRSDSRMELRVTSDNRRGSSLDRRTRSVENIRSNMVMRSEQQIREIRGAQRRSELREAGRSIRRGEVMDSRIDQNSENIRLDARRIEKGATRGTAQAQEVVRTVRERMDGGVRRMSRNRMNQNVRDNQRNMRTVENRRGHGGVRMDRDETRDSRLPATRLVTRYTRSVEDLTQTDRRARGAGRDMDVKQADRRHNEDRRRETTILDRAVERMERGREDVRRRQTDRKDVRSLQDVHRSDRKARIINGENRRNSENRLQRRDVLERDSIRTDNRNTREDFIKASIRVRDSGSSRSARLVKEMRQLDRSARMASDNRVIQVESRRLGEIRRETRSIGRMANSIQNTNDVSRETNEMRDSRFITRNSQSIQDVRRSDMRDQSLSRRGIEIRRERRVVNRVDENSVESRRMKNNVRDSRLPVSLQPVVTRMESRNILRVASESNSLDGRRSVARNDMESRRLTKRQVTGFSRDMTRSGRLAELTRHRGDDESQRGIITMRRGVSPMVELAAGSSRIRSDARSHMSGDVRFSEREERRTLRRVENMRERMYIRRDTRNLKMLKSDNVPEFRTERGVRNTGRSDTMRFESNDERSVDGLRRLERQTRLVSNDGQPRREENRRVRENRVEASTMVRRMDARSLSTELRDSRSGNPVRQLARGSRSMDNVRGADRKTRSASNERDSNGVYNRRNDEDRMRRVDDEMRSDRRVQHSGDGGRASDRRVERWSEGSQREARSFERESSNMRRMSFDVRSSLLSRSIDNIRRNAGRGEIDSARRETRRLDDKRSNSEIQREMRNFVVNKNFMERRQTEMRRMETEARNIRTTDGMRRSDRTPQLSRAVRRMENTRSVDDKREREIRRVENKVVDTKRMYSDDKDSRFTSARVLAMKTSSESNKQSEQIGNSRERTERIDSRRDGRSQRDVMRLARDVKSFDGNLAVAIRFDDAVRRTERMARNNPKAHKNPDSRTQGVRKNIYHPEIKLERTLKPDSEGRQISAERATHKWHAPAYNSEQILGTTQNTDYYAAAKSIVTNWVATFGVKMADVSRLGETVMYGGIVCYALFTNVGNNIQRNIRSNMERSEQQIRGIKGAQRRSELREDGRSIRREHEVKDSRSDSRMELRVTSDNRRGSSLDRRTRSVENIRSNMVMRSEQQIREIRGAQRRSELREAGRSIRRGEVMDSRIDQNSENIRLDARRIEKGATRGTAQAQEVVRTVRERMDGGVRRMSRNRMNQNVRDNQRNMRTVENRRGHGGVRMDRDETRDSRLPATRLVTRYTRSVEDLTQTDRRARGAGRDMDVKQADRRHNEDRRRETTILDRAVERMERGREDVRRRQTDRKDVRSLQDVHRSDRKARIINGENRRNSENRLQRRDVLERDSIRTDNRNTREDFIKASIRVRDSGSSRSARLVKEMRQLDRSARMASDNRVIQVESRRLGEIRRETRSIGRMANSIQNTNDVSRETNEMRDSRFITRNSQSIQDVRRSDMRDQSLSRRGIEIRRERRVVNRVDENSVESRRMKNNVRDSRLPVSLQPVVTRMESRNILRVASESNSLDGRRSVARNDMESRRLTKRQVTGFSRDMTRSGRLAELTRHRGDDESQRGIITMRRGVSPMVELAAGSSRIRSDARSHMSGDVRFSEREERRTLRRVENMRERMYIRRDTRNLKMLKSDNVPEFRTERGVRNTGRSDTMRFESNDERSVDGLRRLERQTRLVSIDGQPRREENRRVRENRVEASTMVRRMDARSLSTELRDSRSGNPVRQLARGSRSMDNVRGADRKTRSASNERDSNGVYNRRNDEDRMRRVDDEMRSDRRVQHSGDGGRASDRRVERWSEGSQREARSFERESSNMRRMSFDVRSSLLSRSIDNIRRNAGRGEIDSARRETRRLDDKRSNSEIQREMRNFVVNKNFMERRQTEMRRMETEARNIRTTDGMRRSDRTPQLSRAVRRMENTRSVDDKREREIRRVENKVVDTKRMYSDDKDSRFTSARVLAMKTSSESNKQSEQIGNSRERTERIDSRRDGRSQRDVMRLARDVKSFDGNLAVAIRFDDAVRRTERMARNNPKAHKNPDSRTQGVRKNIYHPEIKLERTLKPDSEGRQISAERATHKWHAPAYNSEQILGTTQNTDYYAAAKSIVTNWVATFGVKMADVSRLGETVMYGGIVCYALFTNVNKKVIF